MALDLLGGVLVSAPMALLAWRMRAVTTGGAVVGFACAIAVYLGAYLAGIAVLGVALLLTVLSSRFGRARKAALGIAEDHHGRGAANVLANCGVGAVAGLLAAFTSDWSGEAGAIVLVTGIAAGASDTVASEIGKALSARPRSFPSFRSVPAGTPGAITVAGTVAGAIGAALIAWPAVTLWLLPPNRIPLVVVACLAGAFIESALATWFEARGVLNNNSLNLVNTASAAAIAVWWLPN